MERESHRGVALSIYIPEEIRSVMEYLEEEIQSGRLKSKSEWICRAIKRQYKQERGEAV